MNKSCVSIGVVALSALTAGASASVIDTFADWDGNNTNGWLGVAQSFTAPTDNVLQSWTFVVAAAGGQNTINVNVYAWSNASGPVGASLYSDVVAWPAGGGNVTASGINLALTAGNLYAFVADFGSYSGPSLNWQTNQNSYSGGDASWFDGTWQYLDSGWNTSFRAEFIPTPGTMGLLAVGSIAALRRRR